MAEKLILADLSLYQYIIVAFSGGKDSLACVLHLLELGVDPSKIELWHHDVDAGLSFMDWPITRAYCKAVADALKLKIYFSWKKGGFLSEMLRKEGRTLPMEFETPEGLKSCGGTRGKISTRLKFPMKTVDLNRRWCSAYLKIMVAEAAFINQPRFRQTRTLFISGERAEESYARAKYAEFEPYRADNRESPKLARHIDVWRPVHKWTREQVWDIIARWKIHAHPCYMLGWGRCSCAGCIFSSKNQWTSLRQICPNLFQRISEYERQLQTIDPKLSIEQMANAGHSFIDPNQTEMIRLINASVWDRPIFLDHWIKPAGFSGDSCGPV